MDNKELNAVVFVLKEWAKDEGIGLNKEALVKFHDLLIKDLAIHRKINIREDKSIMVSNLPDSKSSDANVGIDEGGQDAK